MYDDDGGGGGGGGGGDGAGQSASSLPACCAVVEREERYAIARYMSWVSWWVGGEGVVARQAAEAWEDGMALSP